MRSSHPARRDDAGFTLIELPVVMVIIGILAPIAIPVFLRQRRKAQDTAAKSDVSTVGKELTSYFVEGTGTPSVSISGGQYMMNVGAVTGPPPEAAIENHYLTKPAPRTRSAASSIQRHGLVPHDQQRQGGPGRDRLQLLGRRGRRRRRLCSRDRLSGRRLVERQGGNYKLMFSALLPWPLAHHAALTRA